MANLTTQVGSQSEENRHDVSTSLNYYPVDAGSPTPVIVGDKSVTNKRPSVSIDVVVHDITDHEHEYTLDKNGFQFVHHISHEKRFDDEKRITSVYYAEVERLLKDVTGASRVVVFNHRARRGPSDWDTAGLDNRLNAGPLFKVHIDQSYDGAKLQLQNVLPDEADELIKGRYQIINVWRPIQTVLRDPLAIADASTVSDADLVPASIIKPNSRSETWAVKPNSAHRWLFKYKHEPGEVVLIKCFDSNVSVARRSPHSAFKYHENEEDPSRKSIEVRAMIFYS